MKNTLLTFGHGYSARALANQLRPEGWRIIGTTRSAEKAEDLRKEGVEPLIWPGTDMKGALAQATHLLISASPDDAGDPVFNALAGDIAAAAPFTWTGYLSTTGVYGDHKGGWVDETTLLTPNTTRGMQRVKAEAQWRDLAKKQCLNLHIFRLSGIYGPGRGPFSKVRNGTARRIIKPGQVFSRTHVDDIVQVLRASIEKPNPGAVYNVCDDDPAPPEDVIAFAAELLGLPVPEAQDWETARLSPMARSFYSESKKVRNDRIKDELGVALKYPNYRTGLRSLLAADQNASDQPGASKD